MNKHQLGPLPERRIRHVYNESKGYSCDCWTEEAVREYTLAEVRRFVAAERDCRTCTRYTLHHRADVPHCSSPIRCVDASRYERADYVQLWEAEPVNAGFRA